MSLFTVGGMAGFAAGPLLITPTLIAFGTRGAMLLAVPVVIMSLAATYQLPRLAAERVPRHRGGARSVAVESREQWSAFARLTVVVMLRSIVFFGLNTFIPLYWSHVLHGSKAGGGYALTTMLSAVVTGTLIGGRMADRYGRKVVVVVSLAALSPVAVLVPERAWPGRGGLAPGSGRNRALGVDQRGGRYGAGVFAGANRVGRGCNAGTLDDSWRPVDAGIRRDSRSPRPQRVDGPAGAGARAGFRDEPDSARAFVTRARSRGHDGSFARWHRRSSAPGRRRGDDPRHHLHPRAGPDSDRPLRPPRAKARPCRDRSSGRMC